MYAIPESGIRIRQGFLYGRSSEKLVSNTFRIRANALIFASSMPTSVIRTAPINLKFDKNQPIMKRTKAVLHEAS